MDASALISPMVFKLLDRCEVHTFMLAAFLVALQGESALLPMLHSCLILEDTLACFALEICLVQ